MGIPIHGMRLIHPGEVLCEELLVPFGLSVDALAMAVQVPAPRINGIVRERRAVPADTALRPAKLFGASAESWLGLQSDYDAALARVPLRDVLKRIQSFEPATG